MKTIILICIFVHILMPSRQALANVCSTPGDTSEMAKTVTKYCKSNLYTFETTSGNSYATGLKTKLEEIRNGELVGRDGLTPFNGM